jgi:hypothetical protein
MKANDVLLITIFRPGLQPYLRLATIGMIKDTLIKLKEAPVICEESGPVITNYDILITQECMHSKVAHFQQMLHSLKVYTVMLK